MSDTLWVAVGFVIFLGIVAYYGGHKALLSGIDGRAQKIAAELAEAKRLREEAEALMASFKAKQAQAEKDAEAMIAAAKAEAERLKVEAGQKLDDFVRRRTAQAELKIAQAEAQASADVRAAAADLAAAVAGKVLAGQGASDSAFSAALGEIKAKMN
ncbi:MAG TPA: ATP F0F1 synthase subunit B [Beijerinckiaceae bacterium]|nr:ATP F0F1 synthase subunit B [Beijerinckiaceae bacterium]